MELITPPKNDPSVWYGNELSVKPEIWTYHFTGNDLREISQALKMVQDREIFDIEDFELPQLGKKLEKIRKEVVCGHGFFLVRGLNLDNFTKEQSIKVFWGLGLYFGEAVSQNYKGHLLGHVTDLGNDPKNPETRVYTTSHKQPYHTDSCDVVGLLCLRPAKKGGESSLVSSSAIYCEMHKRRPDLLKILCEPFYVDRKGEVPEGMLPYYELPVFHPEVDHITTIYARDFINAAQRHAEVPRLTPSQIEALDMIDKLAESHELRLDMTLKSGDIQLCHNHTILHSRTSYMDCEEVDRKRHLLRLWLSQKDGRELPPGFHKRYGEIRRGFKRGGIQVPGMKENIPYYPE